jgi:membrane-associated phospholipid phosphatase
MDQWKQPRSAWRGPALVGLSGLVLVGLSVAFVDQPVSTFSHDVLHRPAWAPPITKLAWWPFWVGASFLALLAVGVYYAMHKRLSEAARIAAAAAFATLLATLAVVLLKYAFGRLWPETWLHPPNPSWINTHQYGFRPFAGSQAYESFPSGHTTRVTAPFAVLWRKVPRFRVLWVLPTLLIMVGLVASDFHFLGDCIAGAYVGIGSAALVLALMG